MLFSVIVPIYNVEKYIRQCIESILNQSYKDFELILVDDGSKDDCPKLCDEYGKKDERIKVIHKQNGGLVSARKEGVKIARGDYVVAVDGDDFVADNILKTFYDILSVEKYDLVCCGYYEYLNDDKIIAVKHKYHGIYSRNRIENEIFSRLITGENGKRFPPSMWAKAFKRELYTTIQLDVDDKISIGEDSCVVYPFIYNADSLFVSEECLYFYRQNDASLTKQTQKAFSWDEILLRAEHYERLMPDKIFVDQIARNVVHSMFNVAITEFYANPYRIAKQIIKNKLTDIRFKKYLKCAHFKHNYKESILAFCVKHKVIILIYLYFRKKRKNG